MSSVEEPRPQAGEGAAPIGGRGPLVRIENVGRSFGPVVALDGVTVDIAPGEFFCLIGPSGCGKTTLLRMIAGFETPDRGRILLDGQDLAGVPPHRRPINLMFQSYALFPHLSVAGNVGFGLKQEGLPKAEIRTRVAEMLALVRLSGLEDRLPAQLSGGQQQRVALARALAKRPRLLLLDEPLAALDKILREETRVELKEIQHRLGTAFVVVTHDQDEAMAMADRIAVLDRGRVQQVGPPKDIYERPANRFVAGFVGDAALIDGRVAAITDGVVSVDGPDGAAMLRLPQGGRSWSQGQPVTVAFRPERLSFSRAEGVSAENQLRGEVADIAFVGGITRYRVQLASGVIVRVAAMDGGGGGPSRGDRVMLDVPAGAASLFER